MSTDEAPEAFHLILHPAESEVTVTALNLLITDASHQDEIRALAREVLSALEARPAEGVFTLGLSAPQMKITHTALRVLLDDLQREQSEEIELLQGILAKLPGEHDMRAIQLT